MGETRRVLLIDPNDERRNVLGTRLSAQGYLVDHATDSAAGADTALTAPPAAIVADLRLPGISGVQLCRLLRSEPATADVPIILCGDDDTPRSRFWASRAGAAAYVVNGRTGELMRALAKAIDSNGQSSDFFVQLSGGSIDIRERLTRHLDLAMFESIMAGELRSLASAASFDRMFDQLVQLLSQVIRYRWIALAVQAPDRVAIHHHPSQRRAAELEARAALHLDAAVPLQRIEDEDASATAVGASPVTKPIAFADAVVARFSVSPCDDGHDAEMLAQIVARELGGAVKIAMLVEESHRVASTDALTGLPNRRSFVETAGGEIARAARYDYPLVLGLLDIDHFKKINDNHGHGTGDRVLAAVGELLQRRLRRSDFVCRWGGEEFVIAFTSTDLPGGLLAAEQVRESLAALSLVDDEGAPIRVTASFGVARWRKGETLDSVIRRADLAMYASKTSGRNKVSACVEDAPGPSSDGVVASPP